ncbi:MAG: Crp/Fnr family transcriptional regulator [Acetobacteraceae bacterium]|nr:Crp/Fnr family transcriptional regulator [Acetobacteraceae bacterium]
MDGNAGNVANATTLNGQLARVPFLAGLPAPVAADFAPRIRWAEHPPGRMLVDFDDPSSDVFFVATGKVRVVVRTGGGNELILEDIAAGGFFGEMAAIDGAPRSASVTALNRSVIGRLAGRDFVRLLADAPDLARRLMQVLVQRLRQSNERMLDLTTLDTRHRLYAELLRQAGPSAPDGSRPITPPPVQQILASRIGARREPVSREIAQLIREGLAARTRGALVLLNPAAISERIAAARQGKHRP